MKVVINSCFGGFSTTREFSESIGAHTPYHIPRWDADLIKAVEADAEAINGACAKLKVVDIPEEATDWELNEYDGLESITYVVDGKLHHIS